MKKFSTKTGYLGVPQKEQKQVADLQCFVLTSLVHFLHNKVNKGCKCIVLDVSDLFLSFCGSANYPIFVENFFITCMYIFIYLYPNEALVQRKLQGYIAAILPSTAITILVWLLQPQSFTELNIDYLQLGINLLHRPYLVYSMFILPSPSCSGSINMLCTSQRW